MLVILGYLALLYIILPLVVLGFLYMLIALLNRFCVKRFEQWRLESPTIVHKILES